jgi:hypothetical protein
LGKNSNGGRRKKSKTQEPKSKWREGKDPKIQNPKIQKEEGLGIVMFGFWTLGFGFFPPLFGSLDFLPTYAIHSPFHL